MYFAIIVTSLRMDIIADPTKYLFNNSIHPIPMAFTDLPLSHQGIPIHLRRTPSQIWGEIRARWLPPYNPDMGDGLVIDEGTRELMNDSSINSTIPNTTITNTINNRTTTIPSVNMSTPTPTSSHIAQGSRLHRLLGVIRSNPMNVNTHHSSHGNNSNITTPTVLSVPVSPIQPIENRRESISSVRDGPAPPHRERSISMTGMELHNPTTTDTTTTTTTVTIPFDAVLPNRIY